MSQYLEKTISNLIESQFPAFYHEEGPVFVEFVKTYFKWMESVSESRTDKWISEGISYLSLESGNTVVTGTNTRLTTDFSDGDRIAISRGADTNAYDIYTINAISNSSYMTIASTPNFSDLRCKFTTVANTGNPIYMTRHFDEIRDIDDTFENFLVYFKEKYLKNLQFINVTNTRNLVKHSLDLYRSKGTERSIELLFRIAFGTTPSVYYPSSDLFRLSDGDWFVPRYIEVSLNENTTSFVNKQIVGLKSGATAFAESVVRRVVGTKLIDVIYISAINGTFETGEPINTFTHEIDPLRCPIMIGSLTDVEIDTDGIGVEFAIGDELSVTSDKGEQGQVRVSAVTNTAGIISFTLDNGGYGYTNNFVTQISDKIISVANVRASNASSLYLYPGDQVIEPLGDINYISATGTFSNGESVYTYHANNDPKGTGRILSIAASNSTTGTLRISVLTGDMSGTQFFTAANAITANQAVSNGYSNVTATGNVVGVDSSLILAVTGANGTFANGSTVFQYSGSGVVTGRGTLTRPLLSVSGDLYLSNVGGMFHNSSPILLSGNSVGANMVSATIRVGIKTIGSNGFVNTGLPYIYSSNTSTNGIVTIVPSGSGANLVLSTNLLYQETISVMSEPIAPYLNVALNATAFGFTGNPTANLTNMTIAEALANTEYDIGKISGIISQSGGSNYGDEVMVFVYDPQIGPMQIPDTFIVGIANGTSDFEVGEYVTQAATGARGIISSRDGEILTLERLNLPDANTWVVTTNSTTTIVGTSSGAIANVVTVSLESFDVLGENAVVISDLNTADGAISQVEVTDSGFGFVDGETVTLLSESGLTLTGIARLSLHGTGRGFYRSKGGFLSDSKKLFDGDYWQNFSYEVRSNRTLDKYVKMLKEVVHVSGTKVFGALYYNTDAVSNSTITTTITKV